MEIKFIYVSLSVVSLNLKYFVQRLVPDEKKSWTLSFQNFPQNKHKKIGANNFFLCKVIFF